MPARSHPQTTDFAHGVQSRRRRIPRRRRYHRRTMIERCRTTVRRREMQWHGEVLTVVWRTSSPVSRENMASGDSKPAPVAVWCGGRAAAQPQVPQVPQLDQGQAIGPQGLRAGEIWLLAQGSPVSLQEGHGGELSQIHRLAPPIGRIAMLARPVRERRVAESSS